MRLKHFYAGKSSEPKVILTIFHRNFVVGCWTLHLVPVIIAPQLIMEQISIQTWKSRVLKIMTHC